jgi:hypothetical protein
MRLGRIRLIRSLTLAGLMALAGRTAVADTVVDFDDLVLAPESSWSGPDPDGQVVSGPYGDEVVGRFTSRGVSFDNRYDTTFGSWSGFAYSNRTDNTTAGFTNPLSAFTGTGHGPGADNYGVAFGSDDLLPTVFDPEPFDPTDASMLQALPSFTLPAGTAVAGMYVTNTTYAALTMLLGDDFSKKFGGPSGHDPDWFKLTAYGTDASGRPLRAAVELYLADFRFDDDASDYVVSDWRYLDLSPLAGAREIHFNLSSSDVGLYGMNTPAFFAVDDIRLRSAPEPSGLALIGLGGVGLFVAWRRRRTS